MPKIMKLCLSLSKLILEYGVFFFLDMVYIKIVYVLAFVPRKTVGFYYFTFPCIVK